MVFLISTLTYLLAGGTLVLAVVLGGAVAYFYAQARRREAIETEREERALRQREAELSHIRHRLEEIYERQQTGTQTQFARVNQELEDLQSSLDAKGRQIDGVQGQLRYELKRHEEEIAALRSQLREAIEVFAAAALPAARPAAPALGAALEPAPPESPEPEPKATTAQPNVPTPEPEPPPFAPLHELLKEDTELLDDMFGGTDLDSDDEPASPPMPPGSSPAEDERSFRARSIVDVAHESETNDDFEFEDVAPPTASLLPWTRPDEAAPFEESDDFGKSEGHETEDELDPLLPTHSGDGMHDMDTDAFAAEAAPVTSIPPSPAEFDSEEPAPVEAPADDAFDPAELVSFEEPEPVPGTAAHDYDDLTALSAVDEAMQQKLYALGITTVEAIARWSRADARRIATQLTHTSEEDIMDRWVFEAQAVLFERYQEELRTQRQQRVASAG